MWPDPDPELLEEKGWVALSLSPEVGCMEPFSKVFTIEVIMK